jgi:S-adenosylmethionine hydrolase
MSWVGICHAVMNRIAPTSPIVDLSHGIPPLESSRPRRPRSAA